MTTDTPRTNDEITKEAKIVKLTKQNYHGLAKSKKVWYETMAKTRDIYEEGENSTTDTPRTDAVPSNQPMLSAQSDPVELYHKLIAVTVDYGKALGACAEYREQLDESKADLMRTQIEMQLEIDRAEAEVERLRGQLTRAVSIAGVLLADIEDFHQGDSDDEWTRNGWNDSRISKYLLQGLREEIK